MNALPILYSFRRCPYAMRARMAVMASGQSCELREVKLANKPEAMLAISPKATVPVLALPGGEVIAESLDIMHWALTQNDPGDWLGRADHGLIADNDGPFKHHLDRYKYPHRHGSDAAEHFAAGLRSLATLDTRLSTAPYLDGNSPSLTDIALFPFVRQFAETNRPGFDAQPLPFLQRWLEEWLQSTLFLNVMTKYTPWQPGDPVTLFP